jgi:prepilin-type N-terminal cleavage/methylation domain-containing protein
MNVQQKNKEKGFTIIEVVLVLAIAGLIFLMVFIALPALQRSQRDTQRRDDVSKFVSQLTSYSTNNRGALPSVNDIDTFMTSYMKTSTDATKSEFNDPTSGTAYTVLKGNSGSPGLGVIQYAPGFECNDENLKSASGSRQAAVRVLLESGGIFCQNAK